MCGRFNQAIPNKDLTDFLGVPDVPELPLRFNVAPTNPVLAVRLGASGREWSVLRWGLVPSWSAGPGGKPLFNARAETVSTKPGFRSAIKSRRCIVPAAGYYAWPSKQQPVYIHATEAPLLALAGLWERWLGPDGEQVESCAVLTTEASPPVRSAHERMPCLLRPDEIDVWLDAQTALDELLPLLRPSEAVVMQPVSTFVNSARNQGPQCVEPLAA